LLTPLVLMYDSSMSRLFISYYLVGTLLFSSAALAAPTKWSQELDNSNISVTFEVHAPWNILDGMAKQLKGTVNIAGEETRDRLRVSVSAQEIDYKAGLSVAGQLVASWLRANPPTPAKFNIIKSSVSCALDTAINQKVCRGSVDGTLTIWGKDYKIDFPVETQPNERSVIITGGKEIKWGEYGFGDPNSKLASIKPVIDMTFSIELIRQK
jgi:polyisoprenoid-binding protein YceI